MLKHDAVSTSRGCIDRIPQTLLLVAPQELQLIPILQPLLMQVLCQNTTQKPCGTCAMCTKVAQKSHPDVHEIRPENGVGPIKIEQIRALQEIAYQRPQLGAHQFWIIQPAEAMNQAAASALLKILEEPPASTLFVLVSATPSLLLPTILSRCQRIDLQHDLGRGDPLALGQYYPESSGRASLYAQRFEILTDLDALLSKQQNPCGIAARWSEHALPDVLWFLYALLAKLLDLNLVKTTLLEKEYQGYTVFKQAWRPERLFSQLDELQALMAKLQNNIPLNTNLALERVLLSFESTVC